MLRLRMKHFYNKAQITVASIYMILSAVHIITCSNIYFTLAEGPRNVCAIALSVCELICLIVFFCDHVIRFIAF